MQLAMFSEHDVRTEIQLPDLNNSFLAYETGVHIGDGSLLITKGRTHSVRIYGHGDDDWIFVSEILPKVIKKLYNKDTKAKKCSDSNKCVLNICSRAIATFKNGVGLSVGKKKMPDLPDFVKKDKNLLINCLRGIADTDFSLYFTKNEKGLYSEPVISCVMDNKELVENLAKYFRSLEFNVSTRFDIQRTRKDKKHVEHHLNIYGRSQLDKWMHVIGFRNPKHITKYLLWQRFGECQPKTSTYERIEMLQFFRPKE